MGNVAKNEEIRKLKYDGAALITFVGFREHLSAGFIKEIDVHPYNVRKIYLFTSSPVAGRLDQETDLTIKKNLSKCERESRTRFGEDVEIKSVELDEIWEISKIYPVFDIIKERTGIVNLSAGPSAFSLSLLLWVINRPGFMLSHVKELNRTIENTPEVYEFRVFNIIPYLNLILNLDDQTRKIIEIIGNNNFRINELLKILNEGLNRKNQMPYRSLYERLKRLQNLGIVEITKNRYLKVRISDDVITIIGKNMKIS